MLRCPRGISRAFSFGSGRFAIRVISGPWPHNSGSLCLPDFCAQAEPWGPGPFLRDPWLSPCPPHPPQLEEAQKQRQERLVAMQQQILQQLTEEEPKVRPWMRGRRAAARQSAGWPGFACDTPLPAAAGPAGPGVSGAAGEAAPGDPLEPAGRDAGGTGGRASGGLCQQWSRAWEQWAPVWR